jgi:methylenetetrahydrofolate reductase (NADPH)
MRTPLYSAPDASSALRAALTALVRRGSIEVSGKDGDKVGEWAGLLPPGMEVYIAWVPGTPAARQAETAARLRAAGRVPVPHIAARQLCSEGELRDLLARLRDEAGVTRALLIAGDGPAPRGPYPSSLAMLESVPLAGYGIAQLDVAGYPEGHPVISEADLLALLRRKLVLARQQGLAMGIVSQFCFDGAIILSWLRRLREQGITAPVQVGAAGPASVRTLLHFGLRCGIGNSLRALSAHGPSLARLLTTHGPEAVAAAVAPEMERLGITGLHLFPFGGFARSARWLAAVQEGRFTMAADGEGFEVEG